MTAIPTVGTLTEISTEDLPINVVNGTARRRIKFIVRVTSAAASNTLDLATYIPNLAGIESLESQDIANATAATSATYATTVLTFAGHTGSGVTTIQGTGYLT